MAERFIKGQKRLSRALTLLEMVIAMAIMTIIFMVLLPQFKNIKNSWDSKQANAEMIQNGRILMEFLNRNLSKAVKITSVSNPSETDGYIEFKDTEDTTYRIQISASNYIEFGPVGDLSELAGPVSRLQFSCYALNDLDTTTTGVGSIRLVKVETTFSNPEGQGQGQMSSDKDFSANIYLQTNWNNIAGFNKNGDNIEFDAVMGKDTALVQVDATHYLLAYTGSSDDGYALILTVDPDTGTITCGTEHEFDTSMGKTPALCQVDATHYLCAYQGLGQDGYAVILTVDTNNWTVSSGTANTFDTNGGESPDLCQIDATHYLCAYQGEMDDGYAVVLTVNTGTWEVSGGSTLEYDNQDGKTPSLTQADGTHFICAYEASGGAGKAVVLEVNTGTWTVSKKSPRTFDSNRIVTPALIAIDGTHHLCVWQGFADSSGYAVVLTVNDVTWTISTETLFDFDTQVTEPALCQMDSDSYLCAYETQGNIGSAVAIEVDTSDYSISKGDALNFDENAPDTTPDVCQIDSGNYICAYTADEADGWTVILCLGIRP
jgi:competence protein ComGC